MIVVDASAVVELLLGTPRAGGVANRVSGAGADAHAPALLDLEVVQVLRRYVREGVMSADQAGVRADLLRVLGIRRHRSTLFLPRIWQFRDTLNAYDASYVALAEGLACPLLTADRRLAAAPLPPPITIELLR